MALLRKKDKKLEALQRELTQKIKKLYEDAVIDNLLSHDCTQHKRPALWNSKTMRKGRGRNPDRTL